MSGGYESEDRQAELEELRQEKEREAREKLAAIRLVQQATGTVRNPYVPDSQSGGMAATPDPKVTAKRADEPKDDRLAMLKELAKLTKPTGPSAKGRGENDAEE